MNRGMGIVAAFVVISAIVMSGQACRPYTPSASSGSSTGASSSGGSDAGLTSFKATFYNYAQTQNCVKCHGTLIAPKFAQPDVQQAYLAASALIDFSNPDVSVLASYAGNSHCGDAACSDPANTSRVISLLDTWASVELGSTGSSGGGGNPGSGPQYITTSVTLPANIPTLMSSATPAVVRFQLSGMSPSFAATNQAIAEVEIQKANATTYRVNRIKIMGNSAAVAVRGVHVYLKAAGTSGIGNEDPNQGLGWVTLQATAPSSSLPATLPTGPLTATPLSTSAIQLQQLSTSDVMTLGFDSLQ